MYAQETTVSQAFLYVVKCTIQRIAESGPSLKVDNYLYVLAHGEFHWCTEHIHIYQFITKILQTTVVLDKNTIFSIY